MTFEPGIAAPEELYNIPDYCPPPKPLPESTMAEIIRELNADPRNPAHFLLASKDTEATTNMVHERQGNEDAPPKAGKTIDDGNFGSPLLPIGHPSLEYLRDHRCPYLSALAIQSDARGAETSPWTSPQAK